jgi:predicted Zn-dependent protease with MMP-like domain
MDTETFRFTAERILNALPGKFLKSLENVVIVIEDFAAVETLHEMQADSPFELLGLYEGRPVTEREAVSSGALPDMIHLYRRPILAMCDQSGEDVDHCIRHVLIHEIGHHFGYSDAEMEAMESSAEAAR